MLGLSVEELAELICKTVPTIRSLESGRLKLGQETALAIAQETGVSVYWLLAGDPSTEPFGEDQGGVRFKYSKDIYEVVQSQGAESGYPPLEITPTLLHAATVRHCTDWLPIFASAQKAGKGDLAVFLLRRFFAEMKERFGWDLELARDACTDSRLTTADGNKYFFIYRAGQGGWPEWGALMAVPKRAAKKAKSSPSQPSSANAHREGGRTSS
jgi:transcriptional regulator with XRE-family HTH domain